MLSKIEHYLGWKDCSQHLGINIRLACFLLAAATATLQAYTVFYIFTPFGFILMGYTIVTFLVAIIAIITGKRRITELYTILFTPIIVPVAIAVGYCSKVLSQFWLCQQYQYYYDDCFPTEYENWLDDQQEWEIWIAVIGGAVSIPFYLATLMAFAKLRRYQLRRALVRPPTPVGQSQEIQIMPLTVSQMVTVLPPRPPPPPRTIIIEPPPAYPADNYYGAPPAVFQPSPSTQPVVYAPFEQENSYQNEKAYEKSVFRKMSL